MCGVFVFLRVGLGGFEGGCGVEGAAFGDVFAFEVGADELIGGK